MQLERKEFKCLLCSHKWYSRLAHPQQCPGCKRKDWDGKHNSLGRPLAVATVEPSGVGSDGGGGSAAECECRWCNHTWVARVGRPQQCPACKRRGWDETGEPTVTRGGLVSVVCEWWCGLPFRNRDANVCPHCMTDMITGQVVDGRRRTTREKLWSDLRISAVDQAAAIKAAVRYTEIQEVLDFVDEPDGGVRGRFLRLLVRPSDGAILEIDGVPYDGPGSAGALAAAPVPVGGFDDGGLFD